MYVLILGRVEGLQLKEVKKELQDAIKEVEPL